MDSRRFGDAELCNFYQYWHAQLGNLSMNYNITNENKGI